MAYKYRQNDSAGASFGYVEYNVSPDFTKPLSPGESFTFSGQLYSGGMTTRSIRILLKFSNISGGGVTVFLGYIDKTISKGKKGTFSIECTIPSADRFENLVVDENGVGKALISIIAYDTAGGSGSMKDIIATTQVPEQSYDLIKVRSAPDLISITPSDRHAVISGTQTPIQYFGSYIQNESLPRLTLSFETDDRDIYLTSVHRLVVTDNNYNTIHDITENAEALATSVSIDLPAITGSGTYNYTWTVTDSAGLSANASGTFAVLPYSPPVITSFLLERYRYVIGEGNIIADDGEKLLTTFEGSVAPVTGTNNNNKNAWTLDFRYNEIDSDITNFTRIASGSNGEDIEYDSDDTPFTNTVNAGSTFNFIVTLSDMLNSVQASYVVLKAGGYLNVEKTGVAVGMRSTSSALDKKFEVAEDYTSHFYGGIEGVNNYSTAEVLTGGHWIDGKPLYHKVLHVTTKGTIDISDLNFDFIRWEFAYKFTWASGTTIQWSSTYYYNSTDYAMVYVNGTNLIIRMVNNIHLIDAYIFLEYTKNTTTTT